jgi:hypothetical protein
VFAGNKRRYRELELDERTFGRSNPLLRSTLEKKRRPCTRTELFDLLEAKGIGTEGQRGYYLLQRAALAGLICLGPQQGRETTYIPLSNRGESIAEVNKGNALTVLAERYIRSHGPATIQDFCWWSGLPTTAVREALQNCKALQAVTTGQGQLWVGSDRPKPIDQPALLLPPFDEYLLGYRERSVVLDPAFVKIVNAGGGMFKATVVVEGKVVGIWKPIRKAGRILISVDPLCDLGTREKHEIKAAAHRYSRFCEKTVEIADL